MNDSIELMCTMSPKIKNKLKPGEKQFRKVRGASILALKKNIRRSFVLNSSIATTKNKNLNLVESTSTESFPSLQLTVTQESIIIIPDTDSSDCSQLEKESFKSSDNESQNENNDFKTEVDCLLPKDRLTAISNWVQNVNNVRFENNTVSSVYMELSKIYSTDNGNDFLQKDMGHAVNSTFVNGHHKKFEELFSHRTNVLANTSVSIDTDENIDACFKSMVIEDSCEMVNRSLQSSLKNITDDVKMPIKNMESIEVLSETLQSHYNTKDNNNENKNSDTPGRKFNDPRTAPLNNYNKWKFIEISDDSSTDENMLDEVYGQSWRKNRHLILSKTEPKKTFKKAHTKISPKTDSKSKFLLNKNPYLEVEKSKSQTLFGNLHKSRLKETNNLINRLKNICDSDTNSEHSQREKVPHVKLNFEDSDAENKNGKQSKYFKKKVNQDSTVNTIENVNIYNKNNRSGNKKTSSRSGSSSNDNSESTNSKPKSTNNNIKSNSDKFKHTILMKDKRGFKKLSSHNYAAEALETKKVEIDYKSKINPRIKRNKNNRITSNSESSNSENDVKVITKAKTEPRLYKKLSPNRVSSTSDDEWEEDVLKLERTLTISNDGTYSFLSSLSENIPLSKCHATARIFKSNYKTYKNQLLKKLFDLYNKEVFGNVIPSETLLEWGEKMTKSAGFCYCKKITSGRIERSVRIVLSTKVVDTADRLRDTLIHEMCHAATYIVNGVSDGHGNYWKAWVLKAMKKFPELPPIKRCHNYVINTKYTYKCTSCGYSINRHSKSLDIERKCCGYCYGKFELLINKTNKKGETAAVIATPKRNATGFALFVKDNYAIYKNPLRKHGDVMKILGQKFKEMQLNKVDVEK